MVDMTEDPPRAYEGASDIRAFGGSQIDEGVEIGGDDNAFGFKWFAYEEGVYRVRIHLTTFGPETPDAPCDGSLANLMKKPEDLAPKS